MDLGLSDKVVFISGGSKGLGLAAAWAFAKENARVVIASRSLENLSRAKEQLALEGLHVETIVADFKDVASAQRAVEQTEQLLGPVDVLINSAGAAKLTPAEELDADSWRAGLDAKFFPYVNIQDAVLKSLRARAETDGSVPPPRHVGSIINIVGIGGRLPTDNHLAGGSANAALLLSTLGLARYYAKYGIRINAINPGTTLTDRVEQSLKIAQQRLGITREEALERGQLATPMRRYGTAEEIANVALFLASEQASYVVGALIPVDGGQGGTF
ncbi:Short-chain dehydrogenase/reductase SDR [Pseudomonas amygdali pv. eriobotryae]|uniref:Short-chain dehydrogenase/reductase SDR n=1 Tax=Pseudomonas amygdali pv. eriobotryae TaxID=129137 RepID=A0A0P9PQJ7_PSEA0|nr:SDR family oxidoreductase [Pseudomonas amygdali]KPX20638.1 Short-chain dehydrogenase/reductase SDR [Pseudomonas amygdali pv. eriobotryae]KWS78389.1 3-oxoacyl-ACP reductase [Pseudomonas amygdali pv. eriobotryae]RMM02438.1 Short-chain dehydrogenase/reductase SDR [Pseudomonas amygdali pv. eriobotryae]RMO66781.1 Short-chain dehydrogenase/reductase SDR [Pseudomonas amygdali pv. eriobotryae]GFZ73890.1 short-chain dehydrogenase [Pseudomonas amygdali pv. eriobotryae]